MKDHKNTGYRGDQCFQDDMIDFNLFLDSE